MAESDENLQDQHDRDIEAMRACVKHSRDLLDSARAVFDIKHANIAFHLALLALEELGRRELIGMQRVAADSGKERPWQKHTLAHTKKIFWCFFGLHFLSGRIQQERLDGLRELSETLHNQRMAGLYVDYQDENLSIPEDAIDPKYCAELLKLAEAQVKLAENEKLREHIEQEDLDLQTWFLSVTSKKENTPLIFSKTSIDKLAELSDAKKWILWLKEQFDNAAEESRKQLQQELERSRSLPEKGTKEKWKIRIRITSQSHSVRQKPLNAFNGRVHWMKLTAVQGKPNELIVEFTFKDNIPIEALWQVGWGMARCFVAALNIATMGFWWWHLPEDIDSYYESVEDAESKARIEIKRNPSLRVDWGTNRVLSEEDMNRTALCLASFPPPSQPEKHRPFDHYIAGLTFLSLNDVHWQCEVQAFGNFFESLRLLMETFSDLQPGQSYLAALDKFITATIPALNSAEKFLEILPAFDEKNVSGIVVTLSEVAMMKILCDSYYQHRTFKRARKEGDPGSAA